MSKLKITPVFTIECCTNHNHERGDWYSEDPLKVPKEYLDTAANWMLRGLMLPAYPCKLVMFNTKTGRIVWQSCELTDMDRALAHWAFANGNTICFPEVTA